MGGLFLSKRNYPDWLPAYVSLVKHTEAPKLNHFWAGVGAIAGALRRKVWIDHGTFFWRPSMYLIFVAPPEVISKSVTAGVAMSMLQEIPGIKFGPDSMTWQSMITSFAEASESFEYEGLWHPMSALTYFSSELGLLVDFNDRALINVLIDFWDGRNSFKKQTKMSGNDIVEAPFINIVACTTPDWIASSIPAIAVGGGFTSRCIFIYAEKKERLVAHPGAHIPADFHEKRTKLLQDLEHISVNLVGKFGFTDGARKWEEDWYNHLWSVERENATPDETKALQRRHTHLNKLAMIVSVSRGDSLCITEDDFELADTMLRETALQYDRVFSRIGQPDSAAQVQRFIEFVRIKQPVGFDEAYRLVHTHFPDFRDFEGITSGLIKAGILSMVLVNPGNPGAGYLLSIREGR